MDITFVILHYKTIDDTKKCVESIEKTSYMSDYVIIIVDNASNNGSFEKLQEIYSNDCNIVLLHNNDNLGFSKGFNVGIHYSKEHYDSRYIAIVNNDIELITKNVVGVLDSKLAEIDVSLVGPMIICRDGKCDVNPIRNSIRSKEETKGIIKRNKIQYALSKVRLYWIYELQRIIRGVDKRIRNPELYIHDQIDYQLHGAFIIFTNKYFDVFDGLDEGIFLYGEESLLYLHIMKNGLHTLYTPDIVIFHREDSATNEAFGNNSKKVMFVSKHGIDSMRYYLKVLDTYSNGSKRDNNE